MLPQVLDVTIPVAVEELVEGLRLDGVLLLFFLAFLVLCVALLERLLGVFGIHSRDESDVRAVARPDGVAGSRADRRQLPGLAPCQIDEPELAVAGTRGLEQDLFAVRAPAGMAILFVAGGQL